MVQITRVQRNLVFTEHQEEFSKYKVISNFSRLRILATVLLVLDILFFLQIIVIIKRAFGLALPAMSGCFIRMLH